MQIPKEIKRVGEEGLQVVWDDDIYFLSSLVLRSHCPSAVSKAQRGDTSHDKPLTTPKSSLLKVVQSSREEELQLKKIWGVGSYAIGMEWADGHNTGIYTFDFLRQLAMSEGKKQER